MERAWAGPDGVLRGFMVWLGGSGGRQLGVAEARACKDLDLQKAGGCLSHVGE